MAVLCAVGDGLRDDPAFVSKLLDAMDGVPVRMLSQAAARRNITLVMAEADLEPALNRVHDRFFANSASELGERATGAERGDGPPRATVSGVRGQSPRSDQ